MNGYIFNHINMKLKLMHEILICSHEVKQMVPNGIQLQTHDPETSHSLEVKVRYRSKIVIKMN